jgi:hypothetical protein
MSKCDSFWRNPVYGGIPGFSRVTPSGVEKDNVEITCQYFSKKLSLL